MPLSVGDKLGPYEITALIGKGGMGEVYRARDPRLNRDVAIKVSTAQFNERFEREAKAIAALNHSHICQVYDVGPNYLVMEFIDGAPLKGPLPLEQALEYAGQIASALEAAHQKNITHRDLKPANILITASGVKLLDFGLAKIGTNSALASDATQTLDLTQAGTVLGTAAYMSPEQAKGEETDARSDIFSFGLVLYEMVSGRRAFSGNSPIETMAAIVRDEPAPLTHELGAASHLSAIVTRCLRKSPAARFQTMSEVRAALEETSAGPLEKQPSIAVLPFANMSRDADDEYFSDGLAEEIINLLAHVPGLKVIARTSAFAFKGKNEDIRKIAETLGVSNVLEGSVRRAGNKLRITGQLIHAADGTHLWSERFDREMTDVFAVQDEIAQAITAALKVTLSISPARERYQPKLAAYEAYLKARHHWSKGTPESLARCLECYELAISLDPIFALAHIGLANYYLLLAAAAGLMPAHQAMPLVRSGARKALDLDPLLPEAHAMLGIVAGLYDYDWKEADRLFRLAMARDPVPPQVYQWHSYFYLLPMGRTEDAVEDAERGVREDPLNLMARTVLGFGLVIAGRYEDASAEARRMLELDENNAGAYALLTWSHALQGTITEALPLAQKMYSLAPWNTQSMGGFAAMLQRTGNTSRAEEVLQPVRNAPDAYGAWRGLCLFHLLCGEIDQAVDWAEKSVEQRDPWGPPFFAFLRSSARWPALAKMMNLPKRVS